MADPVFTITPEVDDGGGGNSRIVAGKIVIGAADYSTGGVPFRTQLLAAVPGQGPNSIAKINIQGVSGYFYEYVKSDGKLKIRQSVAAGNPFAELSAAALPAGVTSDVLAFDAIFKKFSD